MSTLIFLGHFFTPKIRHVHHPTIFLLFCSHTNAILLCEACNVTMVLSLSTLHFIHFSLPTVSLYCFSCPHTSPKNGKVELMIHTTNDVIRTLLLHEPPSALLGRGPPHRHPPLNIVLLTNISFVPLHAFSLATFSNSRAIGVLTLATGDCVSARYL